MNALNILNVEEIRTNAKLEGVIHDNFPWLDPYTTIDRNLVNLSGGVVNYDGLIGKLVRRRKNLDPVLVVTNYPIFWSDIDIESYTEVIGGGVSYFKPPHKFAVVSSVFAGIQVDITAKAVHEIAHWYGLSHHWLNPRARLQCPMVTPKYSGDLLSQIGSVSIYADYAKQDLL